MDERIRCEIEAEDLIARVRAGMEEAIVLIQRTGGSTVGSGDEAPGPVHPLPDGHAEATAPSRRPVPARGVVSG